MRTLFVGGCHDERRIPVLAGADQLVALDALTQATFGGNREQLGELRHWEERAPHVVLRDLERFCASLEADTRTRRWLHSGQVDLAPALRWPDAATFGFPSQWLANRIAREIRPAGEVAYWGSSAFQWQGLCAALERPVPRVGPPQAKEAAPRTTSTRLSVGSGDRRRDLCDILYLALEPHVAVQQDRLLALLSDRYRIRVVVPLRGPWPWPDGTRYSPAEILPLRAYVEPGDYVRLAAGLARRFAASRGRLPRLPWMPIADSARWLRQSWFRAGTMAAAVRRAVAAHKPRLLLATNLASGMGCVIARTAADAGVKVLGLPSGGDYLLPPLFAPEITRHARIVVPSEGIRARLAAAGADPSRLEACGWPELDDLVAEPLETRSELLRRLGLRDGRKLVVFFSSPSGGDEELLVPPAVKSAAFEALATACRELALDLVVKLHPRERDDTLVNVASRLAPPIAVVRSDLAGLLHAAGVVASLGSAVGFAAAVLGKPVLLLGFGALPAVTSMSEALGIGSAPVDLDELREALKHAAADSVEPRSDIVGGDGKTSLRIASLVDRLLA